MVRRSFRFGLRMGLLLGIGFAVFKTVQSRRTSAEPPAPAPWKPITDNVPRPAPAPASPPTPAPAPTPTAQPEPPVDEVGEPIQEPTAPEPAPEPEPSPARVPAAETVEAAKKAEPVKKAAKASKKTAKASKKTAKAVKKAAKTSKVGKAVKQASKAAQDAESAQAFVVPEDGTCPPTHPIKAKLASRLFHAPGMFAYPRTKADRCYSSEDTAAADGFNRAKR